MRQGFWLVSHRSSSCKPGRQSQRWWGEREQPLQHRWWRGGGDSLWSRNNRKSQSERRKEASSGWASGLRLLKGPFLLVVSCWVCLEPFLVSLPWDPCFRRERLWHVVRVCWLLVTVEPLWCSLTSVGPDHSWVQYDEVVLHPRELEHTLVLAPVFSGEWGDVQVHAHLEGSVVVGQDLSVVHVVVKLLSVSGPEHEGSVRVETCSVAADWRGGGLLEQRHWGDLCTNTL